MRRRRPSSRSVLIGAAADGRTSSQEEPRHSARSSEAGVVQQIESLDTRSPKCGLNDVWAGGPCAITSRNPRPKRRVACSGEGSLIKIARQAPLSPASKAPQLMQSAPNLILGWDRVSRNANSRAPCHLSRPIASPRLPMAASSSRSAAPRSTAGQDQCPTGARQLTGADAAGKGGGSREGSRGGNSGHGHGGAEHDFRLESSGDLAKLVISWSSVRNKTDEGAIM